MTDLVDGFHAASSRKTFQGKWLTIEKALKSWGLACFPPSRDSIMALAASLKASNFATADSYLYQYRITCERRGFHFDAQMDVLLKDCARSCQRGVGGPCKALSLPFLRLGELNLADDGPWQVGGPVGPSCAVIIGAWFLTREIELSTTRARHLTLGRDELDDDVVKWVLPASKSDQQALGKAMVHGCSCGPRSTCGCPFHAGKAQLARLRRLFPDRFVGDEAALDLPLFPTVAGKAVEKDAMVLTIVEAARKLRHPIANADGSAKVTGHSLRVTGAQGLTKLGVDSWAVQLLGRWGSSTVLEYIKDVPLELSSTWAKRAARRTTLEDVSSVAVPRIVAESRRQADSSLPLPPASASSLVRELEVEQARRSEEVRLPAGIKYLKSSSGVWHKVLPSGRVGPVSSWSTRCGWMFSKSSASFEDALPVGTLHFSKCRKCDL